jgi:hypothetical protein
VSTNAISREKPRIVALRQQFGPNVGLHRSESKRSAEGPGGASVTALPRCFAESPDERELSLGVVDGGRASGAPGKRVESLTNGHRAKRIGA